MTIDLLKIEDLAKRMKLSKSYLYELVATERIPHIKIGGTIRFCEDDIINWLKSQHKDINKVYE